MSTFHFDADEARDGLTIVYDGECPFCKSYVGMLALKDAVGAVRLVDARDRDDPVVREVESRGFDLDEGMALLIGGSIYHGSDCLHVLALLTGRQSMFNAVTGRLFKSRSIARYAYPLLRAGRGLTLRLLGRERIRAS